MLPVESEEYDQNTGHCPEDAARYVSDIRAPNRLLRDQKPAPCLEPEASHKLSPKGLRVIDKRVLTARHPTCGVPKRLADRDLRSINRREKSEWMTRLISHLDISSDTIVNHRSHPRRVSIQKIDRK